MSITTLAAVRAQMQISDETDTDQDDLIESLILAVDDAIQSYTQREFAPLSTSQQTRDFRYNGGGVLQLAPYDLKTLASIQIDVDGANPSPTTLTADDYRLMPIGAHHGVYSEIHLRDLPVLPMNTHPGFRVVRVTGVWGWTTVPSAVQLAANVTVAYWLRQTSQHMGDVFGEEASITARMLMPPIAKRLLDPYKRRGIG